MSLDEAKHLEVGFYDLNEALDQGFFSGTCHTRATDRYWMRPALEFSREGKKGVCRALPSLTPPSRVAKKVCHVQPSV
jgi:hypothetical protein